MNKYEVLANYIKAYFEKNILMTKEDAELILKALEETKEEKSE